MKPNVVANVKRGEVSRNRILNLLSSKPKRISDIAHDACLSVPQTYYHLRQIKKANLARVVAVRVFDFVDQKHITVNTWIRNV
jgi:hypothetical protein